MPLLAATISIVETLLLPLALVVSQLVASLAVLPMRARSMAKFLALFGLVYGAAALLLLDAYLEYRETSWLDIGMTATPTLRDLALGLFGTTACVGIFVLGKLVASRAKIDTRSTDARMRELVGDSRQQMLAFLGLAALGGGILEEIVFRGIMISQLQTGPLTAPGALVASALAFAVMHLPMLKAYGSTLAFFAGLVLGGLFLLSGSLHGPMLAHGLTNCIMVLFIYYRVLDRWLPPGPSLASQDASTPDA